MKALLWLALALAALPVAVSAQVPPWENEIAEQRQQIEYLKAQVTTLESRVGELERESDVNMNMWQRQLDHEGDRWLKEHPLPPLPKPKH